MKGIIIDFEKLRDARETFGLDRRTAAREFGISVPHLVALERGTKNASRETLDRICAGLGLSAEALASSDDLRAARRSRQVGISMPPELHERLKEVAAAGTRTVSQVCVIALTQYLQSDGCRTTPTWEGNQRGIRP